MTGFSYRDGVLCAERAPLTDLARRFGTPAYVYSRAAIEAAWRAYTGAIGRRQVMICYAVKANGNLAVLNLLARLGCGFDIVSGGELERVVAAGGAANKTVFSGVGKSAGELRQALELGVRCINVESEAELLRLDQVAGELGVEAPVSIRVNPDINPDTHPYIATGLKQNKFGIAHERAPDVYQQAARLPHVRPVGIGCHIGSQLGALAPYAEAIEKLLALLETLEKTGIAPEHVDLGGGLGIDYRRAAARLDGAGPRGADGNPSSGVMEEQATMPDIADLVRLVLDRIPEKYDVILEPGRSMVGNAGVLLTRVEYLKTHHARHFVVVDAAMNDLLRPALYQAWQDIVPVMEHTDLPQQTCDVVGPICESGDFLGLQRRLAAGQDDLLAVLDAGAYGFSMSSNYNGRPRAIEIMADGEQAHVIRPRESVAQLMAGERCLPE